MQNGNKTSEVDITYTFKHPRTLVFSAWTNADYLSQWFAPHGCSLRIRKLEVRKGGSFHYCISNPAFGDCWCIGVYQEIKAPEKIVYTLINADENGNRVDPTSIGMDPEWPGETLVTITFSESDGITTVRLRQTVSEVIAKRTGAHPSWIQMLERLETVISQIKLPSTI